VGIADHELAPAQNALFERDQDLVPKNLALTVPNLEAEQLTAAFN